MHLKTLSLVGFKSFADRTRLMFEPGVTVVVGPNGSGKSNLVDAVAWVMGTQATSTLRTDKMDDVIFAGTAIRPGHSRAEVSVTFDNEARELPLDLPEITVTRRLHRDGTSEYEINGTPCRLLDIQELLADGGIGRHQHVIVGQGRVDAVLNAGPEEHRAIIEEAAGVIKHRRRRDRSLRRLDATAQDVQRLQDLLSELQRRMRPLKRQARAAERYEGAKTAWRELRLWLGGERLRTIGDRLAEIESADVAARSRLADAERQLAEVAESLGDLQAAAGEVGRALERDTTAAARLETTAERLQRIGMVAAERRRAMENRLEESGERRRDLHQELEDLTARLEAAVAEESAVRHLSERREVTLRALEDEERSLAEQDQLPAEGVVASLRGDLSALESAARRDQGEMESVSRRLEVVRGRVEDEKEEASRLREGIRSADVGTGPAQAAYQEATAARESAQQRLEDAERALADAKVAAASAAARLEALSDGMAEGPGLDLAMDQPGVLGPAVLRLDVPEDLTRAVDAALGGWGGALAVDGPAHAVEAASAVAHAGYRGVALVVPAEGDDAAAGGTQRLIDRLGPACDRRLAEMLLGDVALVDDWESGWDLVSEAGAVRAVTRHGDLVTRSGIRLAGPEGGRATLEGAKADMERARTDEARAASRVTTTRREFVATRERERIALEAIERLETEIGGASEALRLVSRSIAEAEAEAARLTARRAALGEAHEARTERLAELRRRLADFEGEEAARQEAWEALARRRAEVSARREAARHARDESAAALAAVAERLRLLERRREEVERLVESHDGDPPDRSRIAELTRVEEAARRALASVRGHVEVLRERQRNLRVEAGDAGSRLEAADATRRRLEPVTAEAREQISRLAVEAAELRVRLEAEAEGLRRDVDADEQAALAADPVVIPDDTEAEAHLASLEAQLRRLGPVNPLAAEEYRELSNRAEFLEAQLGDLEDSRRELRKVIGALDDEIARLFREAFAEIAHYFEESFVMLFPGGRGRLALSDPEDPLTTGVLIHAQPMGKKVGRLSLLSGGERSLAALAFLFAVFRARPSPFYVLDEVEAALDDANLRRFIRLVGTLRTTSQLVIVTHQQQTMEAADLLYGVTMEPGQSSRILAKRLSRVEVTSEGAA